MDNLEQSDTLLMMAKEQNVTPWSVSGEVAADGTIKEIDYNKLVEQFGTKLIDDALLERFERVTGHKPHRFLRRGIVFSHRDLSKILDRYEKGQPFYLYTGRGPSSGSMHVGHSVPFEFTKYVSFTTREERSPPAVFVHMLIVRLS